MHVLWDQLLYHALMHTCAHARQRARVHRAELDYLRRMRDRNKINAARTILTKWNKFLLLRPFTKWKENAVEFAEWRIKGRKAMMRMVNIYAHTTIYKTRARICLCTRAQKIDVIRSVDMHVVRHVSSFTWVLKTFHARALSLACVCARTPPLFTLRLLGHVDCGSCNAKVD